MSDILLICVFLFCFLSVALLVYFLGAVPVSLSRASLVQRVSGLQTRVPRGPAYQRILKASLTSSGMDRSFSPDEFLALQVLSGAGSAVVGGPALLFLFPSLITGVLVPLVAVCLLIGGFFVPILLLRHRASSRQAEILRTLPYYIDLLTLAVEAGLDFGAALGRISQSGAPGPLKEELTMVLQKIRLGRMRREALRDLSERIALSELTSLITALIQADQLGTSLGQTLRIQSDELRIKRSQRIEKLAHAAPIKMLVPLLFCIFPSAFIILFGPIILRIAGSLP